MISCESMQVSAVGLIVLPVTLSGNCDIDVDECDSSPCQNWAQHALSRVWSRLCDTMRGTSAHVWLASRTGV